MNPHLHKEMRIHEAHVVEFTLSCPAKIMFLDNDNYLAFTMDYDYDYYGTETDQSPFLMGAPHTGYWHLIIEPLDPSADLRLKIRIVEP